MNSHIINLTQGDEHRDSGETDETWLKMLLLSKLESIRYRMEEAGPLQRYIPKWSARRDVKTSTAELPR
jgi:hypothetical protein